jgi:hypothetical protein
MDGKERGCGGHFLGRRVQALEPCLERRDDAEGRREGGKGRYVPTDLVMSVWKTCILVSFLSQCAANQTLPSGPFFVRRLEAKNMALGCRGVVAAAAAVAAGEEQEEAEGDYGGG